MIIDFKKYILNFIFIILLGGCLTSCVDEKIIDPKEEQGDIDLEYDGYSVGFAVTVDAVGDTRAVSNIDDYIDTKDKFRVFFFDENGNFLFNAIDRTVTPLGKDNEGREKIFVRIPMNYIVDRHENTYDAEVVRNYLRTHSFKIAVLANWPNEGRYSGIDPDDDSESGSSDVTPDEIKGEPNWDWDNSILNENVNDEDIRNINDLHHLVKDNSYDEKKGVYGFVMDANSYMGVKTSWVNFTNGYSSDDDAEKAIRSDYNPAIPVAKYFNASDNRYSYMRFLWNFTAAVNYNNDYSLNKSKLDGYFDSGEKYCKSWLESYTDNKYLNNAAVNLKSWLGTTDGRDLENFNNWTSQNYLNQSQTSLPLNFLRFHQAIDLTQSDLDKGGVQLTKSKSYIQSDSQGNITKAGVRMPVGKAEYHMDGPDILQNVIHFSVPSSGYLYMKLYNPGSSDATMAVYFKKTDTNATTKITDPITIKAGQDLNYNSGKINITGNSGDLYIYTTSGEVVVSQIEYVRSTYLYQSDRKAIMPSESQPIPMYGVQNYTPLINWEQGSTMDLSGAYSSILNSYEDAKDIYLIRSLAKIEVYLPKQAKYVFMRCLNRFSRCETVDVETPTDLTWKYDDNDILHNYGSDSNDNNYVADKDRCEWFSVKNYGVGYTGRFNEKGEEKESDTDKGISYYQTWLSWFYGSWKAANWQNKGTSGWPFTDVTLQGETDSQKYPHVFYPDINRSDFAEFHYEGISEGMHKYVMYMPDKNIDDPNKVGVTSSIPKIAHIEYRYDEDGNYNLDDDNCYRIYFADLQPQYKTDGTPFKADEFEQDFEKRIHENNSYYHLWPVMRNHIYSFYVSEGAAEAPTTMEVRVRVTDWKYEQIINNLW